jgi:hypothetical protein
MVVWFIPMIIGAVASVIIDAYFLVETENATSDALNGVIAGFIEGIQYGITFWEFLVVCWPMILGFAALLYAGYRIATPKGFYGGYR